MRIIGSALDCSDKRKRNNTVSRKVVKSHCCNRSSWMWTLHSCFKKLVELLVMMTTDQSWLNGVSMNNNWLPWCKGTVLCVLPMTLSTTSRDEIWYYKYRTNIYICSHQQQIQGVTSCGRWCAWVWIYHLPGPSREWRPCPLPSLQLPIMAMFA